MNSSHEDDSITNLSSVNGYNYSVQLNRWLLKPIGVWPSLTASTKTGRVLARLLKITCHLLTISTFAPTILYILYEKTSLDARMKAIGPMSHWLMGELNYCSLLTKYDDILHCIKCVRSDWQTVKRPGDREIMLKNARFGRFIGCALALGMNLGVFAYCTFLHFQKATITVGNETFSVNGLTCPVYSELMDVRFSPLNDIVFVIQCVSLFVANCATAGACSLAAFLAMHACGQLSIILSRLDELVDEKDDGMCAKKKLAEIVQHHYRVISFVSYIEKIMNQVCLVELLGCTLNMCMLEYYILTEPAKETKFAYAIIYTSMCFNIFIFCYIGETVTNQCKKVGEKAYMTDWYLLPHKTALGLVLIISRSSVVIKITAGKFMPVSVATFGDVFKASFAYFNMLRTTVL